MKNYGQIETISRDELRPKPGERAPATGHELCGWAECTPGHLDKPATPPVRKLPDAYVDDWVRIIARGAETLPNRAEVTAFLLWWDDDVWRRERVSTNEAMAVAGIAWCERAKRAVENGGG